MIPHSAAFAAAVVQTHEVEVHIEFLDPEGSGSVLFTVSPDGGGVAEDRAQSPRTTCEFTLPGALRDIVPPGVDPKILLPFGTECRVWRGIPDVESMLQGVFWLTGVNTTMSKSGLVTRFRGADRSKRFRKLLAPGLDVPGDTNYAEAIVRLLTQSFTGAGTGENIPGFSFTATDHLTPSSLHVGAKTDGWEEARRWSESCAKELFLVNEGVVALYDLPSLDDPPVWEFVDGSGDTRVSLSDDYSSEGVFNYWTVNATHSSVADQNISGTVWVDDPTSPLFVGGPFRTSPDWFDSVLATSVEQCQDEARTHRAKVLAGTDTLTVEAVPNEALQAGDVVLVTAEELDIFDRVHIISSRDLPLDDDSPMRLTLGRG